jgi:hypothetical protein
MPDSYPTSWKEPYHQALKESDQQKLTELVQAAEYAIDFKNSKIPRTITKNASR